MLIKARLDKTLKTKKKNPPSFNPSILFLTARPSIFNMVFKYFNFHDLLIRNSILRTVTDSLVHSQDDFMLNKKNHNPQ